MPDCPLCQTSMRLVKHVDLEIDVCDTCHGIWLDPEEFKFLHKLAASLSDSESAVDSWNFKCPGCESRDSQGISTELGTAHRCISCLGVFLPRELLEGTSKSVDNNQSPDTNWFRDVWGPLGYLIESLSSLK